MLYADGFVAQECRPTPPRRIAGSSCGRERRRVSRSAFGDAATVFSLALATRDSSAREWMRQPRTASCRSVQHIRWTINRSRGWSARGRLIDSGGDGVGNCGGSGVGCAQATPVAVSLVAVRNSHLETRRRCRRIEFCLLTSQGIDKRVGMGATLAKNGVTIRV